MTIILSVEILASIIELFETKYQRGLRRADRAISEQIDLVQVSENGITYVSWGCKSSISHFATFYMLLICIIVFLMMCL